MTCPTQFPNTFHPPISVFIDVKWFVTFTTSQTHDRKQRLAQRDVTVAFISRQGAFKKPVEQMLGRGSERDSLGPGAINQALTAAARLRVRITQHDKYNYWPICKKSVTTNHPGGHDSSEHMFAHSSSKPQQLTGTKKKVCARYLHGDLLINEIRPSQTVCPSGGEKLSWSGNLHIREERQRPAVVQGKTHYSCLHE